jgi:hypothetical protein
MDTDSIKEEIEMVERAAGVLMDHFVVESPGALLAVRQSRDDGEPSPSGKSCGGL